MRLRSLTLALLLSVLMTGLAGLPLASADPSDPTPDPTETTDPTPEPEPTKPPDPTPDPQPTKPPEPPPPDDGPDDPSPTPSPGSGKEDGKDKGKPGKNGKQDRNAKRDKDPFALAGPQNTARLVSLLAPLTERGVSLEKALLKVVGPFPVAGLAWWSDDWHAGRCCPVPHLHQGLDIFAPPGTPLVAAADGYISQKVNSPSASGLGLEVTDARGIQYFYAHLSAFEPGIEVGTQVEMGQVIGYVGDTGNARGTIPHLHFERQPGGVPGPPKPWVDRWLRIAERKAMQLVQETTGTKPKVERLTFRLTRLFDLVDAERTDIDDEATADTGELLVLTGLHPAATYDMARETAGTMAWEIDWGEEAADQIATGIQEYQQEVTEQTLLEIIQEAEAGPVDLASSGMLPGTPGVTAAEGIGDPTVPVATEAGGLVAVPAVPGAPSSSPTGSVTAEGLPIGAPGAVVPPSAAGVATTSGPVTPPVEQDSAGPAWRSGLGAGLAKVLTIYGGLFARLPEMTQTLWHEVVAAVQERGVEGLLRPDNEARFPAATGTP